MEALRWALPSKGEMEEPTLSFLAACGLEVNRSSSRQYTGEMPPLPEVRVLFQRAADIPYKVEEGTTDLGITGLDVVRESWREGGDTCLILEDLGFSRCELVMAVPEAWLDVSAMADLAELSLEMQQKGRPLRVATRYPRLVGSFCHRHGVHYFHLVAATGALEAAPTMGYADIVADLTASGATLRENRLKTLADGLILRSQACLIGNRRTLGESRQRLETTRRALELVEAHLNASGFYLVTANVRGPSPEAVAERIKSRPELAGLEGPTVAPVYSKAPRGESWYAVSVVVAQTSLLSAVEHLRQAGASGVVTQNLRYVFPEEPQAFQRLRQALGSA